MAAGSVGMLQLVLPLVSGRTHRNNYTACIEIKIKRRREQDTVFSTLRIIDRVARRVVSHDIMKTAETPCDAAPVATNPGRPPAFEQRRENHSRRGRALVSVRKGQLCSYLVSFLKNTFIAWFRLLFHAVSDWWARFVQIYILYITSLTHT